MLMKMIHTRTVFVRMFTARKGAWRAAGVGIVIALGICSLPAVFAGKDDSGAVTGGAAAGGAAEVMIDAALEGRPGDGDTQGTGFAPCCFDDGTCDDIPPLVCAIVGGNPTDWWGGGSCFVAGTCPQPGACCLPSGQCVDGAEADGEDCTALGGVYSGANTSCAQVICPFPQCPSGGGCFTMHGGVGCSDTSCCNIVCNSDSFCCTTEWDALCLDAATALCNTPGVCGVPSAGSCAIFNGTPGCSDIACCSAVCAIDRFCCDVEWDQVCVEQATLSCGLASGACCYGPHCELTTPENCAATGGAFGGIDVGCTSSICLGACCYLDGSCSIGTSSECIGGVFQGISVGCTTAACPQPGACCLITGACVQGIDVSGSDCLAMGGEYQGADTACGTVACPNPACPGQGFCVVAGFTPGCADETCCATICGIDPFCCSTNWDNVCADAALSNPACTSTACNEGAGSCGVLNGTPGCNNTECCNVICAFDPFCCATEWDQLCVNKAAQTLACGAPSAACCAPNGVCIVDLGLVSCASIGGTLVTGATCAEAGCVRCPWDCAPAPFGNGVVTIDDLVAVINSFGEPGGPCDNSPDNGDGTYGNGNITIDDLVGVLNHVGPCP
jgi:hypothetical protein